jgi:hypothetical protein
MNRKTEIEQWFSADSAGNKWDGMYTEETPGPDELTGKLRAGPNIGSVPGSPTSQRSTHSNGAPAEWTR